MNVNYMNLSEYPHFEAVIRPVINVRNRLWKSFLFKDDLKMVVAGGSIVSCFLDKPINDIDLFANNPSLLVRNMEILVAITPGISKVCETEKAITYDVDGIKVQAVTCRNIHDGVDELFETFDLLNSCIALEDNSLVMALMWMDLLKEKRLVVNRVSKFDPAKTIYRMMSYATKGFNVSQDEAGYVMNLLVDNDTEDRTKTKLGTGYVRPGQRVYNSRS